MSTPDFFRSRLDAMIDLRHPLAVLANRMPWTSIEATLTPIFEGRAREGRVSDEVDLFGVAPKELSKNNFYKLTCPDSMKGWMRTKLESQRSSGH